MQLDKDLQPPLSWRHGETYAESVGPRLGAFDRRVYAASVELFRHMPVETDGTQVRLATTVHNLVGRLVGRESGVQYNAASRDAVRESLQRLRGTSVRLVSVAVSVEVPRLLDWEETSQGLAIALPRPTHLLFGLKSWWGIPDQALSARVSGLKAWLVAFYSTHSEPYPIQVETLHRLSGFPGSLPRFRDKLGLALKGLSDEAVPVEIRVRAYAPESLGGAKTVTVVMAAWKQATKR
ncbi:hypothetical protein [Mitsuaria sp. TWR114]|uniref:hypothetical protein n=1 Tax=Mitsuaria sp. TWR114 TaxID=2601731 RepID=UPI0011BDA605|nr:hypothetical protein [Mitsuaria sp. TWR114]